MDEIFIKAKYLEANDFKNIREYFNKKDIISLADILDAFEYELKAINGELIKEKIFDELDHEFAIADEVRDNINCGV